MDYVWWRERIDKAVGESYSGIMGKQKDGGSYRGTLEIVGPFNYHDGFENHTEPLVGSFFW